MYNKTVILDNSIIHHFKCITNYVNQSNGNSWMSCLLMYWNLCFLFHLTIFVYVYMSAYLCMHVSCCVSMHGWRDRVQPWMLFLTTLFTLCFETQHSLSLTWNVLTRLGWLASELQGYTWFCFLSADVISTDHYSLAFYLSWFWELNEDLYVCTANSSPTGLSPAYFYFKIMLIQVYP